jgi:cytoskeleton protein RodZ
MAAERNTGDFGSFLKAARERRGVSLGQIARATKISVGALEALERNDISRLPGGIFSRAFVRSYAIEVGLDPDETIQRFVAEFPETAVSPAQAAAEQQEEEEVHESNQQTATTFVRLIGISVVLVAGLVYFGTGRRNVADTPAPSVPVRGPTAAPPEPAENPPAGVAAPRTVPQVAGGSSDGTGTAAPGRAPAPATAPAEQLPRTQAAGTSDPLKPLPASPAPSAVPVEAGDRVTVALVASGPCWVSAIVDGERLVAREFQTGERISFEVGRSVVLTAGDAAALAVTINGEEARALGSAGQVVTVRVTPDNFKEYLVSP